jgi:hypothetical protein
MRHWYEVQLFEKGALGAEGWPIFHSSTYIGKLLEGNLVGKG